MNAGVAGGVRHVVEATALDSLREQITRYVGAQRWSGGRGGAVTDIEFVDAGVVMEGECTVVFTVVRTLLDGSREVRFALPIGVRPAGDPLQERAPSFMIGSLQRDGGESFVYDAAGDPAYIRWMWHAMREGDTAATEMAELRFGLQGDPRGPGDEPHVRWLSAEQTNTSVVLDDMVFLKHLRRIEDGPSHELEMSEALVAAGFEHLAPTLARGLYAPHGAAPCLLAHAQPFLHNAAEGWALALTSLRDLYASAEEEDFQDTLEQHAAVDEQGGAFTAEAARLGVVVAGMHRALASDAIPEVMRAQPLTREQLDAWADSMTADLDALLRREDEGLAALRGARAGIAAHFDALRTLEPGGLVTRIHGDLHLGQVLRTDSGWYILDFEGEPNRTPAQRRELSSPLRDVAGMLRSFDYAAAAALAERGQPAADDLARLRVLGDRWAQINRDAFWSAYLAEVEDAGVLAAPGASITLRRAFEVQKAIYELGYELGHRPGWAGIPLGFLLRGAQ